MTPRAIDPYRVLGLLLMVLSTAVVVTLAWAIAAAIADAACDHEPAA